MVTSLLRRLRRRLHDSAASPDATPASSTSTADVSRYDAHHSKLRESTESVLDPVFAQVPLIEEHQSFRLLRLPRPKDEDLPTDWILESHVFDEGERPSYTAVSYTWGSGNDTKAITVNGHVVEIGENLFHFLQGVAEGRIPLRWGRHLWIDQICINQRSTTEKNSQVQQMNEIYLCAEEVLVWLGPERDGSERVIDLIASSSTLISRDYNFEKRFEAFMVDMRTSWGELELFLSRGYWRRLWVVQEFMLARFLRIYCGAKEVDHQSLLDMLKFLSMSFQLPPAIVEIDWVPKSRFPFKNRQQVEVLWHFSHLQCQDLRDKIYGLQALVQSDERIAIDYDLPAAELFWLVVHYFSARSDSQTRNFLQRLGHTMGVTGRERNYSGENRLAFEKIFPGDDPRKIFRDQQGTSLDHHFNFRRSGLMPWGRCSQQSEGVM